MKQDVATNNGQESDDLGVVFDVGVRAREYFFKKYLIWMEIAGAGFIVYLGWIIIIPSMGGDYAAIYLFILVGSFHLLYLNVKKKIIRTFMEQFAKANNMTFQVEGLPENLDSKFFAKGSWQSGYYLITGSFNGLPLCLFDYEYVTGSGRSRQYDYFTIFRLDMKTPLPPLIFQQNWFCSVSDLPESNPEHEMRKIILEGKYDDAFSLLAGDGFEIEALQIFDLDFLAKMKSDWKEFSLEFINDYVYIFHRNYVTTSEELCDMYRLARYIMTRIKDKADRLRTEIVEMKRRQLA